MTKDVQLVDGNVLAPTQVCAAVLGVTTRTIRRRSQDCGAHREKNGHDLTKLVQHTISQEREAVALTAGEKDPALQRWREARAKLAEIDLAERRGQLLDAPDVYARSSRQIQAIKSGLLMLPGLAPQLAGMRDVRKIQETLRDAVIRLCNLYAEGLIPGNQGFDESVVCRDDNRCGTA
jgi:hypothetical protein